MTSLSKASVRVIPNSKLYVSEPEPVFFGNGPNAKPGSDEAQAWTNDNWLKSRFHFSFAEYDSLQNSSFGVLRVMNDDLVQPYRGFGTHPHINMEIVTYVVHGHLTHQDSIGTPKESLGRGSVQYMTAGTGIRHSEFNESAQPLRFIQTWILPSDQNLVPKYGSYDGSLEVESRKNKLQHLVSDRRRDEDDDGVAPVQISQDVDGYAAELSKNAEVTHELLSDRQAYLLCMEGVVEVNGNRLSKHDACEIQSVDDTTTLITIKAVETDTSECGDEVAGNHD